VALEPRQASDRPREDPSVCPACRESRESVAESRESAISQGICAACRESLRAEHAAVGLYNELLLKDRAGVPTHLQNAYMYASSVLCNLLVLLFEGRLGEAVARDNLSALCTPTLLAVVAIMSSVGVVTGFFLRHLDSVLKAVASALEVVLSMLLSSLLFAVPLTPQAAGAALLVGVGVALYARPPSQPAEATTAQGYAYSPVARDELALSEEGPPNVPPPPAARRPTQPGGTKSRSDLLRLIQDAADSASSRRE